MSDFNQKVKSIITSEVKFILLLVTFIFGVAAPYFGIKQDIALIQKDISIINTNHEAHIQDIMQQLKDNQADHKELEEKVIKNQEAIIKLLK